MTESELDNSVDGWPAQDGPHRRIAIVGPNPAMDRTEEIRNFRPHEVNRALASRPRAGGKSFIVARALRRLGTATSLYGFLGGATGQYLRTECAKLGIRDRHTPIDDDTRINTIIVDQRTNLATVINEPGPLVSESEIHALMATLSDEIAPGDLLILTGSLPRGAGDGLYADLVSLAVERGALPIVDAEGQSLILAVAAHPWVVKCNLQEFRSLAPDAPAAISSPSERDRLLDAMRTIVSTGVQLLIVTLGADGLVAVTPTESFEVAAPRVETKNATGSGDTFLAAFSSACASGSPLEAALAHGAAAASANAAVLIPDIGANPSLRELVERTIVRPLHVEKVTERLGADQ